MALLLGQPLVSCIILQENTPTGIIHPPAYREGPARADAALPSLVWWRGFDSKELTDLIEEALASNLDIAAAVARIIQADANARIAGAPLLPVFEGNGSAQRSLASLTTNSNNSASSGVTSSRVRGTRYSNVYTASISASYEIDFWGKNRAAQRAAEEAAVASRFDREVVGLTTVVSVANAYFLVLASQDRLRIARENLAAASRVYDLIKQRFDVGTASQLDVAQQESAGWTAARVDPAIAAGAAPEHRDACATDRRPPEAVNIRGGSMNGLRIPPVTPGLPSDLVAQRPDIREAEAQLASANASVYSARVAFFPSIQLTGQGGVPSALLRTLLRPESTFFNVAAGLTQPILDGGLLQGQLDLQVGRQDELLQLYRKSIVNGFADVDRALVAMQETAQRERLQRAVVASSRRAFDISETRLREGTIDLVTLLNTQQTLFQAQDVLALAQLDRCNAVVSLFQALGGGWQKPPPDAPPETTGNAP